MYYTPVAFAWPSVKSRPRKDSMCHNFGESALPVWLRDQVFSGRRGDCSLAAVIDGVPCFPSLYASQLVTKKARGSNNPKATLALNVSFHSIHAPSIHGQTHPLDLMHACLNVIEIVRLVACELVASRGGASAVVLACCCKSFEDPVLDALWATQDGLLPLLKSFPEDVWNEGGCTVSALTKSIFFALPNDSGRKAFKRPPTKTEWDRLRKYAQRMRGLKKFGLPEFPPVEVFSVIQLYTINEPLFPNLKSLFLWGLEGSYIPYIPLFLSSRTTSIFLSLSGSDLPTAVIASMVATLSTLCPDLQEISLYSDLPKDPAVIAAISGLLLDANQNILQKLAVNSPLTKEAGEVIYKLPNLCDLSVVIERETSLPPAFLPNLTNLTISCDNEGDWPQLFHGAILGKLESIVFYPQSEQIGDFLEAFERAALSSSIQNTLSKFSLSASFPWNPNYSSFLPFTQMKDLEIEFSCDGGCSSKVDDDIIVNLSQAMPELQSLKLGDDPCCQYTTGVTAKGLMALAHYCRWLAHLRIHFQVASLTTPPAISEVTPYAEPPPSWTNCGPLDLIVGDTPMPEGSALVLALTLLRIFPRITVIYFDNKGWEKVDDAIYDSGQIVGCSSEQYYLTILLEVPSITPLQEPRSRPAVKRGAGQRDSTHLVHNLSTRQNMRFLHCLSSNTLMYNTEHCGSRARRVWCAGDCNTQRASVNRAPRKWNVWSRVFYFEGKEPSKRQSAPRDICTPGLVDTPIPESNSGGRFSARPSRPIV